MKLTSEESTDMSKNIMRHDIENQLETSNDFRVVHEAELNDINPDQTEP